MFHITSASFSEQTSFWIALPFSINHFLFRVFLTRSWYTENPYWNFNVRELSRPFSFDSENHTRENLRMSVGVFIHRWKYARILYLAWWETHIVSHDPFTFTRRRGWRTEKWGSRANATHSRVMHATLSRCSMHVSSATVMDNDTYHVILYEEISPLQVGLFPSKQTIIINKRRYIL